MSFVEFAERAGVIARARVFHAQHEADALVRLILLHQILERFESGHLSPD
jgi:hypothetical protein